MVNLVQAQQIVAPTGVAALSNFAQTGLVPVLSGYSGSGFTVSANSEYSASYAAWKPFGASNADWATASITSAFWLQIQCPRPLYCWKALIQGRLSNENPQRAVIQGSNNAATWVTLALLNGDIGNADAIEVPLALTAAGPFQYYRLYCYRGGGTNPGVQRLQFYQAS